MSEDRLRDLLRSAAPDFDPLDLDLSPRRSRPWLAVTVAAVVVALIAVTVVIVRDGSPSAAPAAASGDPSPTTSSPELDLAALTKDIPCGAKEDTRRDRQELVGFAAVAVFSCGYDERTYPDGEWSVRTRLVTTSNLGTLAGAIADTKSFTGSYHGACTSNFVAEPYLVFVASDGATVTPRFARDECDKPVIPAAVPAIHWTELSATKDKFQRSTASVEANCEQRFKGPKILGIDRDNPAPTTAVFANAPQATLRACIFGPDDDPDVGDFVRGVTLSQQQSDQLRTALSGPAPTGGCESPPGFAVVLAGGQFVEVELGGCYRVLREHYTVGTADPAVIDDLLGTH